MSVHTVPLCKVVPPSTSRMRGLIKAHEEGGDRDRMHGQGPLIRSGPVIMWSGLRETEIETQGDELCEREDRKRDGKWVNGSGAKCPSPSPRSCRVGGQAVELGDRQ